MPIHIPILIEPFNGTPEQWQAYFDQQSAGMDYIMAYRDTIGIFALFSRKKAKNLEEARKKYHQARDKYWSTL